MGYSLSDLRSLWPQWVRNAADSTLYPNTKGDVALMLAGDHWCRMVKPKTLATVTLSASSQTITMPAAWRPEYHLEHTLLTSSSTPVDPNITFADYNDLLRARWIMGGTSSMATGTPTMFAFSSNSTSGFLDKITDVAYSLLVWYRSPFPSWTAGGTASVDFSAIPDEQLRIIATDGVESKMQATEPQNRVLAAEAALRFEEAMWRIRGQGTGGRGGNQSYKDDIDPPPERYILV